MHRTPYTVPSPLPFYARPFHGSMVHTYALSTTQFSYVAWHSGRAAPAKGPTPEHSSQVGMGRSPVLSHERPPRNRVTMSYDARGWYLSCMIEEEGRRYKPILVTGTHDGTYHVVVCIWAYIGRLEGVYMVYIWCTTRITGVHGYTCGNGGV